MGGHPVEDDADPGLVEFINEVAEVVGSAETRSRRIVGSDLVAPGSSEGVLGEGHELDVGEAHLLEVGDEFIGESAVSQALLPRSRVDFVDRHRAGVHGALRALGHPLVIAPLMEVVGDDGGSGRGNLSGACERISLLEPVAAGSLDLVLVSGADLHSGDEDLPDSRRAEGTHRSCTAIPEIEIADDADSTSIRCPHGEGHAFDLAHGSLEGLDVGAENLPELLVTSLGNEVGVHLAQGRQIVVRVVEEGDLIAVGDAHAVVGDLLKGEDHDPHAAAFVRCRI